ncbi:acyltransferase family protein [Curtobacterium flaccumfaciens]|uniref:acyltransferase family protein n=1 Tax=Curtobacterium flaccumfaciens TaxID=2035 RepID=UPI001E2C4BEB|nr:acyltransferase family protein [Curtobacterium allii]MCE0459768.1 acyltransferase [Curtobacterium allii]
MSTISPLDRRGLARRAAESRRIGGLDGIRGVMLLGVVLFHVFPSNVPGGFIGVDVFFVISGFVISTGLLREAQTCGTINLIGFAARRTSRLLPAAMVMTTVVTIAAGLVGGDVVLGLPRQLFGLATLTSNWEQLFASHDYFAGAGSRIFDHCWSLAVEEQFYLICPMVLLAVLRWRRTGRAAWALLMLLAGTAAIPLVLTSAGHFVAAYLATPSHAFGLTVGVAIAAIRSRAPRLAVKGAAMTLFTSAAIAFVVLTLLPEAARPQARSLFTLMGALVGAGLIVGVLNGPRFLNRVLDEGPLGWLGRRSYGIYLWHFPLIVLVGAVCRRWFGETALTETVEGCARLIAVVVAVVIAAASFRWVETPITEAGLFGIMRRPLMCSMVGLGMIGCVVAIVLALTAVDTRSLVAADGPAPLPIAGASPSGCGISPSRRERAASGGKNIVAIGDSVMLASACGLQHKLPGTTIDAVEGRQLVSAPELVRRHLRSAPSTPTIILGLGVNGVGGTRDLDAVIRAIGRRRLVLVDVSAPVAWEAEVNVAIKREAVLHPNVRIADWQSVVAGHPDLVASDGIHPGEAGGERYAAAVVAALRELEHHGR